MTGHHDVIVVGGGVTGAGIARDLALRGASVLLLEKGDYGGATTGGSSWLLHGGTRYLGFDWDTTKLSCEDAGRIVGIARHMVHRAVFLLPVLPDDRNGLERLETALEVYDRLQPLKHSHPHVRLSSEEALAVEPGLSERVLGALTMEEWGVDPLRLAWANVQDALAHGAETLNHAEVDGVLSEGSKVIGVFYRGPDGSRKEARSRVVINATGPWVPELGQLAGVRVRLRPTKGVHLVYDRRLSNFALSAEAVDGRSLLMVPLGNFTLLGTTDDDFYGDLDVQDVLPEEVDYLLQGFQRVFPAIRSYRPVRSTSGVRPTLFKWRANEDVLSRRYEVFDHSLRDGLAGFISVAGGKLSMYRVMAERTADAACRQLGISQPSLTATEPLPGNESELEPAAAIANRFGLSALAVVRAQLRHGSGAERVLRTVSRPRVICRCDPVTDAELTHAVRHEQVTNLGDAFRRIGLAAGPCGGFRCLRMAAAVMGRELDWNASQAEEAAVQFARDSWRGKAPVLDRWGWAQEELWQGARREKR